MFENLLQTILDNLMALLPFVIIRSYEMGCRWTLGRNPRPLEPGLHWRIYLYHSIDTVIVVDDVIELPTQSVITKDEKLVCFKAVVGYRIADVVKHCNSVTDFTESTKALAKQHLAKRVRENSLSDLISDLNKLEKSLSATLTTKFKDWGTDVTTVGFTDFAEVPTQVRIFQDEKLPF